MHESIRFTHIRIQNQEYHLNMMDTSQGLFRFMAGRGFFEFFLVSNPPRGVPSGRRHVSYQRESSHNLLIAEYDNFHRNVHKKHKRSGRVITLSAEPHQRDKTRTDPASSSLIAGAVIRARPSPLRQGLFCLLFKKTRIFFK